MRTIIKWHDANKESPQKNGDYLVYCLPYMGEGKIYPQVISFAIDLHKVDYYDFHNYKGESGWYKSSGEYGYYLISNVVCWAELPTPAINNWQMRRRSADDR